MRGVLVGCDYKQEWLLPWWWDHYSKHNSFPVAFFDFGLSKEGRSWCKNKGLLIDLLSETIEPPSSLLDEKTITLLELTYGKNLVTVLSSLENPRSSWLKKPQALLKAPFSTNLWIDTDCEIKGSLAPLFSLLKKETDIAIARDPTQLLDSLLPEEVCYNSGVILFYKNAKFIEQTLQLLLQNGNKFAGDQNALSRAIYLHNPSLIELPQTFNFRFDLETTANVLIKHYSGSLGKIEILNNLPLSFFQGIGIPKRSK